MNAFNPKEFKVTDGEVSDVPEVDSLQGNESDTPGRTLKIEADGDFWKGLTKPKIRLMGRWLERAGFSPGNRVQVTCVAPGIIELRCHRCLDSE